jgi:hypothetical protein
MQMKMMYFVCAAVPRLTPTKALQVVLARIKLLLPFMPLKLIAPLPRMQPHLLLNLL